MIVIDYVQLLQAKGNTRVEQVTNISLALHTMAQRAGIAVIALSQLSRPEKGQQRSRTGADPNSRTGPQAKRHLAQLLDGKKHQQAQRVGGGVIHRFRIHPLCSKAMFVVCGNVHKMHLLLFVRI